MTQRSFSPARGHGGVAGALSRQRDTNLVFQRISFDDLLCVAVATRVHLADFEREQRRTAQLGTVIAVARDVQMALARWTDILFEDYRAEHGPAKPRIIGVEALNAANISYNATRDLYGAWSSYAQVLNESARFLRGSANSFELRPQLSRGNPR